MTDCFRRIKAEEGLGGFYKGLQARMMRVGIEVAITFGSYNLIKDSVLSYMDTAV